MMDGNMNIYYMFYYICVGKKISVKDLAGRNLRHYDGN